MKRILIALAVLVSVQVADAQTKTPEAARKAVENAEAASKDAKKAAKVATWTNPSSPRSLRIASKIAGRLLGAKSMSMSGNSALSLLRKRQ